MKKAKAFLNRFAYRGVVMAIISGVLGVLIAMGVIDEATQASIMANAEYILGLMVAIGLIRTRKDVKRYRNEQEQSKGQ